MHALPRPRWVASQIRSSPATWLLGLFTATLLWDLSGLDTSVMHAIGTPQGFALQDAWWPTGDLGEIDADGFVHVRGRIKHVLITAFGRNVSPEWVETALRSEGSIAQAVVFGEAQAELSAVLWPMHPAASDADLQIDSLWTHALHLADVQLDKPKTEILFSKDGSLNLTQLFKLPASEPTPADPQAEPFPLRIDRINLAGGNLHFQDLRPSEPIEFLYDKLDFELKNLSTLPEDNADMTLVAAGPEGGQIDWKGNFSLVPITSQGTLKVTDGKMKSFWPYVRDALPLVLEDGVLNLSTEYKLILS